MASAEQPQGSQPRAIAETPKKPKRKYGERSRVSAVEVGGSWINPATGNRACGAKCRNGSRCPAPPMENGRCRMHGGMSPSGTASPHWKGKGYSKHLPKTYLADYEEALNDPELISSRHETALFVARAQELTRRLASGESGQAWETMRKALGELTDAIELGNPITVAESLAAMREAVESGYTDELAWRELLEVGERKTKVAEREVKRLLTLDQMIPAEQAHAMVSAIVQAIHDEVRDDDTRARVGRRLDMILNLPGRRAVTIDVASLPAPIEAAGIEEDSEESPVLEEE